MAGDKINSHSVGDSTWTEWSQHILKELERLNGNYEAIRKELGVVKEELAIIKNQQTTVGELKQWKKEFDEVISPSQLRDLREEVKQLSTFKTMSTTIWVVVQVLFGLIIAFKDKIWP